MEQCVCVCVCVYVCVCVCVWCGFVWECWYYCIFSKIVYQILEVNIQHSICVRMRSIPLCAWQPLPKRIEIIFNHSVKGTEWLEGPEIFRKGTVIHMYSFTYQVVDTADTPDMNH